MPRGADTATTVSTDTGKDDDRLRIPTTLQDEFGKVASRVFHHLVNVWTGLLNGDSVDLGHLFRCYRAHRCAGISKKVAHTQKLTCNTNYIL